jgi:hypothetical protein
MSENEAASHRQQDLYPTEVRQLMVAHDYMRRYRDVLARRVTWFGALRAIASSSAIGAWVIWRSYPMGWAGIIVTSQVADALRDVFPFTVRHKAANDLVTSFEVLLIDALHEAEGVYSGQFTDEEITDRRHKLILLRHEAEVKHFPSGHLPERKDLLALADEAAIAYFDSIFGREPTHDQDQRRRCATFRFPRSDALRLAEAALGHP